MTDVREHNWRHFWLGLAVAGLLASVQGSGWLRFGRPGITPDLVLCAVIAWSFLSSSVAGAIWGFVGGAALDGLSAGPAGVNAIALVVVGAVVGAARLGLYSDDSLWVALAGLIGTALFYAVSLLILALNGWGTALVPTLTTLVLPTALLDVVCVLVLMPVLRLLHRAVVGRVVMEQ